ncbi:TPA: Ig-like domain-containing protein [Photobacterium damselae]
MMKKLLLFIFALFIYGCGGGGGDDGGNIPKPIIDDIKAPLVHSRVSQINLFEQDMIVSLKKSVKDPQGLPVSLVSVKALTDGCSDPIFDQDDLTFDVVKNDLNYCAYQYTVKNHSSNAEYDKTSSSISYVVMSETGQHSILDPLSASTTIGKSLSIDLKNKLGAQIPDNFVLQDDVYILGSGTVTTDLANSLIIYNADSVGVTRLMYSLHDEATNETRIGYIDIAVSEVGNSMPVAEDFAGPENLAVDTTITIDVNNPTHISDPDGDSLQLTDVYVYNDEADVDVFSQTDVNNTKFTFSASQPGTYDVTYVIYDHRNGFAIGIVRITVEGPELPWKDIILPTDGELYTAPLEKNYADLYHIDYQALTPYILDNVDYDIPKFNYAAAQTSCLRRGMVLPTESQLLKLYRDRTPETVEEKNRWPMIDKFWTSTEGVKFGTRKAFSFTEEVFSDEDTMMPYVVTCVSPGILSAEVSLDNQYTALDIDSPNHNEVTATILGKNGEPLPGVAVYLYSNDKDVLLAKTQEATNSNGKAVFEVRSKTGGAHNVLVSYYSQTLEQKLNFILDKITRFEVSPESADIKLGESGVALQSELGFDSSVIVDTTKDTKWTIESGSGVVRLEDNLVKGVSAGTAIIKGTYIDQESVEQSDFATITVINPISIDRVELTPNKKTIDIDEKFQLTFTVYYSDGHSEVLNSAASWGSYHTDIATVDNSGVVTGVSDGDTMISAWLPDQPSFGATSTITVNKGESWGSDGYLEVTPKTVMGILGEEIHLTAIAHTETGSIDVTDSAIWETSEGVGTITGGVARSTKAGYQKVTATYTLNGETKTDTSIITWASATCRDPQTSTRILHTNPGDPGGIDYTPSDISFADLPRKRFGNKVNKGGFVITLGGFVHQGEAVAGNPTLIYSENVKEAVKIAGTTAIKVTSLNDYSKPAFAVIELTTNTGSICTTTLNMYPN